MACVTQDRCQKVLQMAKLFKIMSHRKGFLLPIQAPKNYGGTVCQVHIYTCAIFGGGEALKMTDDVIQCSPPNNEKKGIDPKITATPNICQPTRGTRAEKREAVKSIDSRKRGNIEFRRLRLTPTEIIITRGIILACNDSLYCCKERPTSITTSRCSNTCWSTNKRIALPECIACTSLLRGDAYNNSKKQPCRPCPTVGQASLFDGSS